MDNRAALATASNPPANDEGEKENKGLNNSGS